MQFSAFVTLVAVGGSAAGLLALGLPFIGNISPIGALVLAHNLEGSDAPALLALAAPALLAIPIALWSAARIFVPTPRAFERRAAYLCASAAMLAIVPMTLLAFGAQVLEDFLGIAALTLYWAAAVVNLGILARNRTRRLPPGVTAEVFLLLAYLPPALYALALFSFTEFFSSEPYWVWRSGAYTVLATCVLYVAQASLRMREGASRAHVPTRRSP